MKSIVWILVLGALGVACELRAAVIAGPIFNPANEHAYYLLSAQTWTASEAEAVQLAGHLVTINNQAEQDWVFNAFGAYGGTNRSLWMGLNDVGHNGTFTWINGEPVTYTNWSPGQPDDGSGLGESYAHMYRAGGAEQPGSWNDLANANGFPQLNPVNGVVETVFLAPQMNIRVSQVQICWTGVTNGVYSVLYSTNAGGTWLPSYTNLTNFGSSQCVTDTVGQPQKIYRVLRTR